MENASKALLIAGGVLLAVIIITMFLSMYNQIKGMEDAKEEKIRLEQIHAFNSQYEAYNKHIMYGADVVTLFNKVTEHNLNNLNEQIEIKIEIPDEFIDTHGVLTNKLQNSMLTEEERKDLLKLRFKCSGMDYASTGKVNKITIEPAK